MTCPEMKIGENPANSSDFSRFTLLEKFPKKNTERSI